MSTLFAILASLCAFIAAVIMLAPWHKVLSAFQLSRTKADLRNILNSIDKMHAEGERRIEAPDLATSPYSQGAHWGATQSSALGAHALDRFHQTLRRSHGLPASTLQAAPGVLGKQKVIDSHAEIESAIHRQAEEAEPRNLRYLAFAFLVAALLFSIISVLT